MDPENAQHYDPFWACGKRGRVVFGKWACVTFYKSVFWEQSVFCCSIVYSLMIK